MGKLKFTVLCLGGLTASLGLAYPAVAQQTAPTLSEQTLRESNQNRSIYEQGGGLNIMQLIHNANLRGNTTSEEFRSRQNETIDSAVEAFRKRRQNPVQIQIAPTSQ